MVREVLRYPDRRLKTPARPVRRPGAAARRLARDLEETARSFPRTVGIAAPQIGELWRIAFVDCTGHPRVPDAQGPIWLVDPVVVEQEGAEVGREGCLSLPDITANVRRATRIAVRTLDLEGRERLVRAQGFEARAILHEIDHLDGVALPARLHGAAAGRVPVG